MPNKIEDLYQENALKYRLRNVGHFIQAPVCKSFENMAPVSIRLGILLLTWINFILTWRSNHMSSKVWDENAYRFSNFNGATAGVWEWIIGNGSQHRQCVLMRYVYLPPKM